MKKKLIGALIVAVVGLTALCVWQYQQAQNSAAALSEIHAALETQKQENANFAAKIDELTAQLAAAQTELQQTKTALKAEQEEAAKKVQEEALKEAQKEADKASSSSVVSKSTPPKTPAKPTTPGGTNGNNTTSKPQTPSNSGSGNIGSPTEDDWNKAFGGEGPKQSGDGIDGGKRY